MYYYIFAAPMENGIVDKKLKAADSVCFNIKSCWHAIARMYNNGGMEYDLSASTGYVLLNIDTENGINATKIAPLLGMESRSLTRTLKSLEEQELIYRQPDDVDKRQVKIFLTQKGKKKKDIARRGVKTFNALIKERVGEQDLRVFFKVINQVNETVGTITHLKLNQKVNTN